MKLATPDWVLMLATAERDALLEAVADAVHRYEAADEMDSEHYKALRAFAEALETED